MSISPPPSYNNSSPPSYNNSPPPSSKTYSNNSKKINNVSERNLAKVLIEFMNLQTPEVQDAIARELCPEGDRIICGWNKEQRYYRITDGILHGILSFNDFLNAMKTAQLRMKKEHNKTISYVGFSDVLVNYTSLPENSDERKLNKYRGMINCCIKNGECKDTRGMRSSTFLGFGFGKQINPETCTYRKTGGRRRTRRKRTRRTRRMR